MSSRCDFSKMSHGAERRLSRERKRNKRFNCIHTDYILLMISEQRWLLSHMWHHLTLIHWRFCLLLLRISRPTSLQPQSRVKLDVIGVGDLPWATFFPPFVILVLFLFGTYQIVLACYKCPLPNHKLTMIRMSFFVNLIFIVCIFSQLISMIIEKRIPSHKDGSITCLVYVSFWLFDFWMCC